MTGRYCMHQRGLIQYNKARCLQGSTSPCRPSCWMLVTAGWNLLCWCWPPPPMTSTVCALSLRWCWCRSSQRADRGVDMRQGLLTAPPGPRIGLKASCGAQWSSQCSLRLGWCHASMQNLCPTLTGLHEYVLCTIHTVTPQRCFPQHRRTTVVLRWLIPSLRCLFIDIQDETHLIFLEEILLSDVPTHGRSEMDHSLPLMLVYLFIYWHNQIKHTSYFFNLTKFYKVMCRPTVVLRWLIPSLWCLFIDIRWNAPHISWRNSTKWCADPQSFWDGSFPLSDAYLLT